MPAAAVRQYGSSMSASRTLRFTGALNLIGTAEAGEGPMILRQRGAGTNPTFPGLIFALWNRTPS
jgi:hypothetical protein